jgi:lysophospholipase L1-like esterase
MAYPAILGRRLERPHINLGFSGNAWSEPEMAQLLAEPDPAVYVLDPLPNMKEEWVAPRLQRLIEILRAAHPKTPIVLVENIAYPDGDFVGLRGERYEKANARLHELYQRLVRAGDKRLLYVSAAGLIGKDTEGTVDGTHPTDLGFMRMADAIEPALRRALKMQH